MDTKDNNLIVLAGAGILLLILIVFAVTGARSEPASVGARPNVNLEAVPSVSPDDNLRGSNNAAVTLIEYSDIECPFCQEYHDQLLDLVEVNPLPNFAWAYRHLPLTQIHQRAFDYAVATECAANQNQFWSYLDTLVNRVRNDENFNDQALIDLARERGLDANQFAICQDSDEAVDSVQAEADQAFAAGATGTPFSVLEFNRSITDAEFEDIKAAIGDDNAQLSDDGTKLAFGGSVNATQIRELVQLVVDPATDQVAPTVSEGTEE